MQIICIAFPSWRGSYVKSTVKLMEALSIDNEVLYIDYQYTILDVFRSLLGKKDIQPLKILGLKNRIETILLDNGGVINLYSPPPVLSINFIKNTKLYNTFVGINNSIVGCGVRKAVKKLNFTNAVLVNAFNPFYGSLKFKKHQKSMTCYYCYDEISASKWANVHGSYLENKLLKEVDLVITSSEPLQISKSTLNPNCFLVKNGVDHDLFNIKIDNNIFNKSKRIIYIGSIDFRLDYPLLEKCLSKMPESEFYFIGRTQPSSGLDRIKNYKNCKLVGPLPYEQLPDELAKARVAIIPFETNDFTKNIYPLKINEYLSAGLPVVTTNFSSLSDFKSIISISNTHEEFIAYLKESVSAKYDDIYIENRKEFASNNSWKNRAFQFQDILKKQLLSMNTNKEE